MPKPDMPEPKRPGDSAVNPPNRALLLFAALGMTFLGPGCSEDTGSASSTAGPVTSGSADTTGGVSTSAGGTTSATASGSTGESTSGDGMVSYTRDIEPIFRGVCTDCHHQTVTNMPNLADPFNPTNGLVNSPNTWVTNYPETPASNLVPGDPDNSFIMDKISNMAVAAGNFMPWAPPRLTSDEITALRQWITDGAEANDFFDAYVRPIFGTAGLLGAPGGKCSYCHHPGGLPPNLSDPFDPEAGLVNVPAIIGDQMRVLPGDPDQSFLIVKVEATAHSSEIGHPMPMVYPALTEDQVATVRQWIIEGAQNN